MIYARAFKLGIEIPKPDSVPIIRAEIHHVTEDGDRAVFISGTQAEIFRRMSDVYAEPVTFVCPLTGEEVTTTVAAITAGVTQAVRNWMTTEIEGEFDEQGRFIVEG